MPALMEKLRAKAQYQFTVRPFSFSDTFTQKIVNRFLQVVAALRGKTYAQTIQLEAEYDPAPPYDSGSPEKADPFVRDNLKGIMTPLVESLRRAI
jgi:hypothetical protein